MKQSACLSDTNNDRVVRQVKIDDLPTEMLLEVFSYLDLKNLVASCCVSSRWKDVGNGVPLMATHKYTITSDESRSEIDRTFQNIPNLRNIKICYSGKRNIKSTLRSLLKFCNDVRDLDINESITIDWNLLQDVVKKFPNLKSLSVKLALHTPLQLINQIGAGLQIQKLALFAYEIKLDMKPIANGCPNLRHIDIRRCQYKYEDLCYLIIRKKHLLETLLFSSPYDSHKSPPLSQCKRLEHVGCTDISHTLLPLVVFLDEISTLSGLKRLDLNLRADVTHDELTQLSKCSFSSTLTDLYVGVYHDVAQEFSRTIVSCLPNVEKLCVEISPITFESEGLKHFLEMKKLTHLGIKWWPLTGPLFETLLQCKQIQHLVIGNCLDLNDENALRLVEEMKLRYLKITQCHSLTDGFLKSFPRCKTLKELHVDLKDPLEQTARELKLREPSTRIIVRKFTDTLYEPIFGDV